MERNIKNKYFFVVLLFFYRHPCSQCLDNWLHLLCASPPSISCLLCTLDTAGNQQGSFQERHPIISPGGQDLVARIRGFPYRDSRGGQPEGKGSLRTLPAESALQVCCFRKIACLCGVTWCWWLRRVLKRQAQGKHSSTRFHAWSPLELNVPISWSPTGGKGGQR